MQLQASFLAYMDAFWVLTLIALAAVPLAATLRSGKLRGAKPTAHCSDDLVAGVTRPQENFPNRAKIPSLEINS